MGTLCVVQRRVVTPYPNDIKSLVRPFVFRKYLDYGAYEAMRNLHRQIRSEVSKKGMADNIKLGAGGIREVEFIAQIFQMIRGLPNARAATERHAGNAEENCRDGHYAV